MNDFSNAVVNILRADPTMDDNTRGDLFDLAHTASSHDALAAALQPLPISTTTKDALVKARFDLLSPVHKAVSILSTIPKEVLDYGEAHPTVFKALGAAQDRARKS